MFFFVRIIISSVVGRGYGLWYHRRTMNELWNEILKQLSVALSETAVSTWFAECEFVAFEDERLVICAGSEFRKDVIEKRFASTICGIASSLLAGDIQLTVLSDAEEAQAYLGRKQFNGGSEFLRMKDFTFDNFVQGEENRWACGISRKVSEEPGNGLYNPVFIYSGSGLGKTHLLYSIGQAIKEKYPEKNIVFAKGDDFLNRMIQAIREGEGKQFRDEFRTADVLLIDDVHVLAGKRATQEEFFNTFNAVYEAGHQIVVTCDRPPKELSDLEERLRTRFESGILCEISRPGLQLRKDIVAFKAAQAGLELSETDVDFIAGRLTCNVRQLEGAVKNLVAYQGIMGKIGGEALIRTVENMCQTEDRRITPELVLRETARYYSVTVDDIKSDSRVRKYVNARKMAMYVLREKLDMTFEDIGTLCGNRDHATVINNFKQVFNNKSSAEVREALRVIYMNIGDKP